jgi:peptidoglycan/xylan/chitin deacetylase (PgdA/CDA1 family)
MDPIQQPTANNIVLLYHEVTDQVERQKSVRKIDPAYSLDRTMFYHQLNALYHQQNLQVVSLQSLLEDQSNQKRVGISFDDGLVGNYEHAGTLLESFQFKTTFFVTVNEIGQNTYMNWHHLRELDSSGHSIQSHTLSHPMLAECSPEDIYIECMTSKQIIEDKIGRPVQFLSLPFGSYSQRVVDIALQVGYKALFSSAVESIQLRPNQAVFGRVPIKDTHTLEEFMQLLNPDSRLFQKTQKLNRRKNQLKQMIGLGNYRRLYRFVNKIEL